MNTHEKNIFINFLHDLVPTEDRRIYYTEDQGNGSFYFYNDLKIEVQITSIGNQVNFALCQHYNDPKKNNYISIGFQFNEVKEILEVIFSKYKKDNSKDYLLNQNLSLTDFNVNLTDLADFLTNTDIANQWHSKKKNFQLELKGKNNDLNVLGLGSIYSDEVKIHNLLYVTKLPFNIYRGSERVFFEYFTAGWEMKDYKAFDSILKINSGVDSLNEFMEKINHVNPDVGALFLSHKLNSELTPQANKKKSHKI